MDGGRRCPRRRRAPCPLGSGGLQIWNARPTPIFFEIDDLIDQPPATRWHAETARAAPGVQKGAARATPRMSSPYVGRSPSTTRSDGRWRSAIRTGGIVRGCSIRPSGESGMRAERSCVCVCPNLFSRVSCSRKAVHTLAFCRDPGGAVLIMLMVLCAGVSRPDPALDRT